MPGTASFPSPTLGLRVPSSTRPEHSERLLRPLLRDPTATSIILSLAAQEDETEGKERRRVLPSTHPPPPPTIPCSQPRRANKTRLFSLPSGVSLARSSRAGPRGDFDPAAAVRSCASHVGSRTSSVGPARSPRFPSPDTEKAGGPSNKQVRSWRGLRPGRDLRGFALHCLTGSSARRPTENAARASALFTQAFVR